MQATAPILRKYSFQVPLTGNSNVCYVTNSAEYEPENLYERQYYWEKQRTMKEQSVHSLKLGPYNAQQKKNMPYLTCAPYRSEKVSFSFRSWQILRYAAATFVRHLTYLSFS